MRVYRSWQPDEGEGGVATAEVRGNLDVRRRQDTAEVAGVARCPRCRAVLVPGMTRGQPGFFCRCIARMPIPA
jgi:hypothetical protein